VHENAAADWEKLRSWEMPFGRFKGRALYDLPAEYLCWFEQHGWPSGDLGRLLHIVLEAKRQGADHAFDPLRKWRAANVQFTVSCTEATAFTQPPNSPNTEN
jgi:hypothetical protein